MEGRRFNSGFLICMFISLVLFPACKATTCYWQGADGAKWENGANWSEGSEPSATDHVQLNNGNLCVADQSGEECNLLIMGISDGDDGKLLVAFGFLAGFRAHAPR